MEPLDKILGAAIELFRQYGFKTITMDDIARRAGISKKTLYQHFANKNEVVQETVTWYKCKISDGCNNIMAESDNAIQAMVQVMGMFDNINRNMNPMAMLELERYFPEAYKQFRGKMLMEDVSNIKANLDRGVEEGLYRADIDTELMARYRLDLSLMIYQSNILIKDALDLVAATRMVSEHYLYGIMTQKGEKLYLKYKEQYFKQVSTI